MFGTEKNNTFIICNFILRIAVVYPDFSYIAGRCYLQYSRQQMRRAS